jgi:hypothetical protein
VIKQHEAPSLLRIFPPVHGNRWKDCRFGLDSDACERLPKRIISFKDPHMITKSRLILAMSLLVFFGFGCTESPSPSKLAGTVKYKGNPVTGGNMGIYAKEGGYYTISINADGTYAAADLPAGESVVTIETESINPAKRGNATYGGERGKGQRSSSPTPDQMAGGAAGADAGPKAEVASGVYVKIPPKYSKKETSGLTLNLTKGTNQKDFDLTD